MRDAEARRAEVQALSDREGICIKLRHDPRITPVGRVLRRWSLDELPQLFNVLAGRHVACRPAPRPRGGGRRLPRARASAPSRVPGITGFWQVSGRADIGFDDMIDLDLDYVRRASVRTDISVILSTAGAVLSGRGAY
jgi:exopolysaccharide production protein ExoY